MADGKLYDWGPPREVVTEKLLASVDAESPTGPPISPHATLDTVD